MYCVCDDVYDNNQVNNLCRLFTENVCESMFKCKLDLYEQTSSVYDLCRPYVHNVLL